MPELQSSRSLLLPGPQPPLSHFGATLMRHAVATGLRYSLHSLGATMPERPPVRFVDLRLHLDRIKLTESLAGFEATPYLIDALLEPGGRDSAAASSGAFRGAAFFHRLRLRLGLRRRAGTAAHAAPGASPRDLWLRFRSTVSAVQPALNEALLGELLAALKRRTARSAGHRVKPCLGPAAFAFVSAGSTDLASLGTADPIAPAWSESPGAEGHVSGRLEELPPFADGRADRLRGEFRESYRRALNSIRAAYLQLASSAHERGVLDEVGDAFFIPFDLAEDLAGDGRPDWLMGAVSANRAEYQSLLEAGGSPEAISSGDHERPSSDRGAWALAPLWPLD